MYGNGGGDADAQQSLLPPSSLTPRQGTPNFALLPPTLGSLQVPTVPSPPPPPNTPLALWPRR